MTASGIRAGKAYIEFTGDFSKLQASLTKMSKRMQAFGASMRRVGATIAGIGAAIGAPLAASVVKFAQLGDQINKMQARTGMAAESLSALGFAAEQGGASIDQLDRSLAAMARFSVMAERGLSTATDVLDMLGVSMQDFQSANPEERFLMLAQALSEVKDPTLRAGLALKVFGRSGRELLPMLENGRAGIEALMKEAKELGIVMSEDDANAAAEMTDALNRLRRQFKMIVVQVGAALTPALLKLFEVLTPIMKAFIDFIKNNKALVTAVGAAAVALVAIGGTLMTLGVTVQLLGFAVAGLGTALAFLATPVGIAIAVVVALVAVIGGAAAAFFAWTESGRAAWKAISQYFGWLLDVATRTVKNIFDAIAKGNFRQAFMLAFAGVMGIVGQTMMGVFNYVIDTLVRLIKTMKEFANRFGFEFDTKATEEWGKRTKAAYKAATDAALAFATAQGKQGEVAEEAREEEPEDRYKPKPQVGSSIPGTFSAAASMILGRNLREGEVMKQIEKNTRAAAETLHDMEAGVPVM